MAGKPWIQKQYTLIVVPHAEAKFRKIKLPYWLMLALTSVTAVLLAALIFFFVHYYFMLSKIGNTERLAEQNQQLIKENSRYEQEVDQIKRRVGMIEDKTRVLSVLAGVKPVESPAMGDISGMDTRFNNEILDREIPLSKLKVENLDATLEKVEKVFNEKQELLSLTPTIWPLISEDYGRITSGRGWRKDPFTQKRRYHKGLDISVENGTPIVAPANGVVREAETIGGLGKVITIDHGLKFVTRYGHLSKFNVKRGDRVKRGDVIGYVGNTGRSTAAHLHYEVHYNGKDVNPRDYILRSGRDAPIWDAEILTRK